jgi:tripartite-type tricarboxylate transporter receptor subunit TctC
VPWGAGGGTDATARIIGSLLEKELGQPVNVVNRTGGSGVVGHAAIGSAPPDGYTIGMITVEIGMMHHQGLTELSGASYTPIGLVNADPAGLQIAADSPYKNVNELVAAIKASPWQVQGLGDRAGRHLASRDRRHVARYEGRSGQRALGAVERRSSLGSRISSRAVCRSRPCRCPRRAH